jgi:O-antigen/teichoic acid export membrane protein
VWQVEYPQKQSRCLIDMSSSHRQIFRSSAVIGGASIINMIVNIVKIKVLAVLLGPAGVGLMGLYQNIMGMAATLSGCGLDRSGVRHVALLADDGATFAIVRRALWLGNLLLGAIGMAALWVLRGPVSELVFGDSAHADSVGWLGLGVLLTLVAGSQTALLRGLRRISDLARVSIFSALVGAAVGILAVYLLGSNGVVWFVLTSPGAAALVAGYYAARLPHTETLDDPRAIRRQWVAMIKLGIPLMAAGLLTLVTQLAVRSIVLRELGLEASGYFQAAWAVSMTYVGLALGAMATDYYPRLVEAVADGARARRLVNEQSEMAILLSGPAFMMMITVAPWVINALYTSSFAPAAEVLRWQVLGDVLKVASWPMGYILMAQGRGGLFIAAEASWNVVYVTVVAIGIQPWGLVTAGVGFCIAYVVQFSLLLVFARRLIDFRMSRRNLLLTLAYLMAGGLTVILAARSPTLGFVVGSLSMVVGAGYSIRRLDKLMDLREWLKRKLAERTT